MSAPDKAFTLESVQKNILEYNFNDKQLLWEALQAAGTSSTAAGYVVHPDGNKRPALIGDAVLRLVLMEDWYHTKTLKGMPLLTFKKVSLCSRSCVLGQANRILQTVATKENLDTVGRNLGLDGYINVPDGTQRIELRTMAATIKGILGAVFLDGGIQAVRAFMRTMGVVIPREEGSEGTRWVWKRDGPVEEEWRW